MEELRLATHFGFKLSNDDSVILTSTCDAHRHSKIAETTFVSFSKDIPLDERERAIETLTKMGAPVFGHGYARGSNTFQSDKSYVDECLAQGRPARRMVYNQEYNRFLVYSHGTYGLSPALMGPLSRLREIYGRPAAWTDAEWKDRTRYEPLKRYLNNHQVPFYDTDDGVIVAGVPVLVSGHVINFVLGLALLCTRHSRAFDYGKFYDDYITNYQLPVISDEPSFSQYSWHSWLETRVAVLSAFEMIRYTHKNVVKLNKKAVKVALMAGMALLKNEQLSARCSITAVRGGLAKYDRRFYTSPRDFKHIFVVMPSGTGKTTLAKKYPYAFIDIDEVDFDDEVKQKNKAMRRLAMVDGDWSKYESWYYKRCYIFIERCVRAGGGRVFLIHHPKLAHTLYPNAPKLGLMLSHDMTVESAVRRSGEDARAVASSNWHHVKATDGTYPDFKIYTLKSQDHIESAIFKAVTRFW